MKQKMLFALLISTFVALLLLTGALFGPPRLVVKPGAAAHLDELLAQWTRDGTFTGSVLIAQDGVVFLDEGYGLADRAQGIPNTPQTRFHLGSISKQFTAMAILILQSQGKLNVQDPICDYIANCPVAWQDITIHQLLTHTSGLSPRLDNIVVNAARDPETPPDPAYFIEITGEVPLETRPGEQYAYSNHGYNLLAHIIEQASGQSYAEFLEENIFTPLNMRDSGYEDSSSGVAGGYTYRYATDAVEYVQLPISDGEGQLYSTTGDLYLWDQALYTDRLLPQAELEPMFERYVPETDYPLFGYGYGWMVTSILGRPVLGGSGWSAGCATIYLRYPADGLTLIVLMNQGDIDHMSVLLAIAGALFLSDLVFLFSALTFNLLLAILVVAQKNGWTRAVRGFGILWLLLAIPLVFVFTRYLDEGMGLAILVPLALVLLYMLVEFLLDFVFKVEFRRNWKTHIPYIVLEYVALFSLIRLAFNIHRTYGYAVSITFWILLAALLYLFWDKIRIRKRKEP
jgi:CubicO group peptidase (beta-lactamase class C family)